MTRRILSVAAGCLSLASVAVATTPARLGDPRQPDTAFESSQYVLGNLLCKANRFLTVGVEYDYGTRANKDGRTLDNHRVMGGMQLF